MPQKKKFEFPLPKIVGGILIILAISGMIRTETTNLVLAHIIQSDGFAHTSFLRTAIGASGIIALIANLIELGIGIVLIVFDSARFLPRSVM